LLTFLEGIKMNKRNGIKVGEVVKVELAEHLVEMEVINVIHVKGGEVLVRGKVKMELPEKEFIHCCHEQDIREGRRC